MAASANVFEEEMEEEEEEVQAMMPALVIFVIWTLPLANLISRLCLRSPY